MRRVSTAACGGSKEAWLASTDDGVVAVDAEPHQLPEGLLVNRNGTSATAHYASEDRRTVLLRALSSHGGNRTAAARALGIGRATFYRWRREPGLGA
jgi:transcriptional regulator of acetoin/glycerol metabolism